MRRCRDEDAHQHARKKEEGRAKSDAGSMSVCPWCRSQLLTAPQRAAPGLGRGKAAEGAPATSRPCLTSLAESQRPATSLQAAVLRGPKSKSRGAAGAPSSYKAPAPRPCSPPVHPGPFALSSLSRRARTLTGMPLQLFPKVPVPGFLRIRAELWLQRQRLCLTSPGCGERRGAGARIRREEGRGEVEREGARVGATWRRGGAGGACAGGEGAGARNVLRVRAELLFSSCAR